MAAKVGSEDATSINEINVVPLVDIILVVLIIFMVAAPLVMQPKIDISLPKSSSTDLDKTKKPMKIVVGKKGELFVDNKSLDINGLKIESQLKVKENPEVSAVLVADKEVTLAMVTEIIDTVKSQGLKKVAFSIQKK
ncbi:MAG: biopolymer transporter ExbD [Bdellovibrionaceae bacterium]|nr:biopolymer transporter ExbD [Pseudobdellovibrionaceae bacterium]NUM58415.1 biopolymer transporter ExbD [Pseudobdellovibrionaceae bacterium]